MTVALVVAEPSLEELAATYNRECALAIEAGTAMIGHVIAAGEALLAARERVPRGQWMQWVLENIDQSPATVWQHMRIARYKERVLESQATSTKGALRLLRGEAHTSMPIGDEQERQIVVDLRNSGMTQAKIAETLGIGRKRVWRILHPDKYEQTKQRKRRLTIAGHRAERRAERDQQAKAAGGDVANAYSLIRRALQACDRASTQVESREARQAVQNTINRLYDAEDAIVKASKLSHPHNGRTAA